MAGEVKVKTSWIYSTEDLAVTAKGEKVAIEVLDSGNWNAVVLDRNEARNLAAQLLAWCATEPNGDF